MTQAEQRAEKRTLWEERVTAFKASGQSVRRWCSEQGLPEHQLRYWLQRILPEVEHAKQVRASRWVAIDTSQQSISSGISLRIGAVVLEVQRGFDQQVLVDVLRSLMDIC
ncbi:MAG: helix-turn-helix domain-containing protein [Firmicutes bacterium]|nr:helix-turn-helix domain-containing protein [Bacillota bacterium]